MDDYMKQKLITNATLNTGGKMRSRTRTWTENEREAYYALNRKQDYLEEAVSLLLDGDYQAVREQLTLAAAASTIIKIHLEAAESHSKALGGYDPYPTPPEKLKAPGQQSEGPDNTPKDSHEVQIGDRVIINTGIPLMGTLEYINPHTHKAILTLDYGVTYITHKSNITPHKP